MDAPLPPAPVTDRTVQIQDSCGNTLECEPVNQFTVGMEDFCWLLPPVESYLIVSPTALEVFLFRVNDENSGSIVEKSDESYERLLLQARSRMEEINFEQQFNPKIAIKHFGPSLFAVGLADHLMEVFKSTNSDDLEDLKEDEEIFELACAFWYSGNGQISQQYGLYYREPDLYVAKYPNLALVQGEEFERIRANAEAAYRATLSTADGDSPITP